MKKILLGFALSLATLSFAQQYPNNPNNNGWGDNGNNNGYNGDNSGYNGNNNNGYNGSSDGYNGNNDGYYSDQDDQNYFPNDYYYNYPQDYYPQDYYQSYYNDYRNSILSINWNVFFTQNRLNRWQIDQVLRLNNLYVSFSNWNSFYRYNPDRWYYDRFYALQRILGPRVFVTFQNNYYHGYSPIRYFQNYRTTYYAPRFSVMPRYRNVNINVYRVDRAKFRGMNNPTLNIVRRSSREDNGFRGSVRDNNNGGFRGNNNNNNSGIRTQGNNGVRNNGNNGNNGNSGGFRGNNNVNSGTRTENNGGFRSGNSSDGTRVGVRTGGGFRSQETRRESIPVRQENNGGGFRQQRSEHSAPRQQHNNSGENRGGGFRQRLARN